MDNAKLVILEEHGHTEAQADLERDAILARFDGVFNWYTDNVGRHGRGVTIYMPARTLSAGFLPASQVATCPTQDAAMSELMDLLHENLPDGNHVPVVFVYDCGHVAGYVMTAGYNSTDGTMDATITYQVFGGVEKAARFVGEATGAPAVWDIEL